MIGTSANLKHNDHILLKDIFYGLMLPSGNDAAWALAEFFGLLLIKDTLRKFATEEKRIEEAVLTFMGRMNSNAVRFSMN
jgi:D-alanyl-D-alanine carboxypeptidase